MWLRVGQTGLTLAELKERRGFHRVWTAVGVAAVAICLWAYGRVTPDSSAQVPRHDPSGASQRDVAAHTGEPLKTTLDLYDLDHPTFKDKLPGKLEEVSGVTAVSASAVACVQDEDGIVFIYDLAKKDVTRKIHFGKGGDYEEVSLAKDVLFVLRSDGVLFKLDHWQHNDPQVTTYNTSLPTRDNEGLGFDPQSGRLLIAPKSHLGKGHKAKDQRPIFAFDLQTDTLLPEPAFVFSVDDIQDFAESRAKEHAGKGKKKHKSEWSRLRFLPASIAVHPISFEIFVLSGTDRLLASFDRQQNVTGVAALKPKLFRQPEGVAFLPNGDMVITNEGDGKKATLLRFDMRSTPPDR